MNVFHTVICQNADLRLINGSVPYQGRIEICWNETWGTICDQSWSTFDAQVACRQLGFAAIGMYNLFKHYNFHEIDDCSMLSLQEHQGLMLSMAKEEVPCY